ncbi:MAG TPA: hypothetical protein VN580_11045, partial [Clostridia bacterium]|nr:hypothetical protein [Clostridia bacterium]
YKDKRSFTTFRMTGKEVQDKNRAGEKSRCKLQYLDFISNVKTVKTFKIRKNIFSRKKGEQYGYSKD